MRFDALFLVSVFLQDLIHDIKSEISGNFETLVVAMLKSQAEYDAAELHNAIAVSGAGKPWTVW